MMTIQPVGVRSPVAADSGDAHAIAAAMSLRAHADACALNGSRLYAALVGVLTAHTLEAANAARRDAVGAISDVMALYLKLTLDDAPAASAPASGLPTNHRSPATGYRP
jgi:hypothetical protein